MSWFGLVWGEAKGGGSILYFLDSRFVFFFLYVPSLGWPTALSVFFFLGDGWSLESVSLSNC